MFRSGEFKRMYFIHILFLIVCVLSPMMSAIYMLTLRFSDAKSVRLNINPKCMVYQPRDRYTPY